MKKQIIISIGREHGSGGHKIGRMLAEAYGIEFYDSNILKEIAEEKNVESKSLDKFDEAPKKFFSSRRVRGESNSPEEAVAHMEFDFLKKKADEGESFVVLGRLADAVLADNEGLVKIFLYCNDKDFKLGRIMKEFNISENEAERMREKYDKDRRSYHDYYADSKWGERESYDLLIDSGKLGIEKSFELIKNYIELK